VASGRPDSVTIHLLTKLGLAPEDMRVEPGTPQMGRRCPKTSIPSQHEFARKHRGTGGGKHVATPGLASRPESDYTYGI
jgi:hypothetical protein